MIIGSGTLAVMLAKYGLVLCRLPISTPVGRTELIKDTKAVSMILLSWFGLSNFLSHSESKLCVKVSRAVIMVTFVVCFIVYVVVVMTVSIL